MHYTKMHGLGNDYLFVFGEVPENALELSRKYSDRKRGIGSDGMIYIGYSDKADFNEELQYLSGT
jgi:diaminopimelate epimerase